MSPSRSSQSVQSVSEWRSVQVFRIGYRTRRSGTDVTHRIRITTSGNVIHYLIRDPGRKMRGEDPQAGDLDRDSSMGIKSSCKCRQRRGQLMLYRGWLNRVQGAGRSARQVDRPRQLALADALGRRPSHAGPARRIERRSSPTRQHFDSWQRTSIPVCTVAIYALEVLYAIDSTPLRHCRCTHLRPHHLQYSTRC